MLYDVAMLAGSFLHLVRERLRTNRGLAIGTAAAGLFLVSFTHAPIFDLFRVFPLPKSERRSARTSRRPTMRSFARLERSNLWPVLSGGEGLRPS